MPLHWKLSVAIAFSLGLFQSAKAQDGRWVLPSPLPSLEQKPNEVKTAEEAANKAAKTESNPLKRLPPTIEEIPLPPVFPHAVIPFRQERRARLIRGNEVMEISNQALRESGVFMRALNSSHNLSSLYQDVQARTLQRQQAEFQATRETAKMLQGNPAADVKAAAQDMNTDLGKITALKYEAMYLQAQAENKFEDAMWNIGLNGAKIASVGSMNAPDGTEVPNHVMIKAMDDSPTNNLGYTMTRVFRNGDFGMTTVPSEYLLPLPVESNDLFYNQMTALRTQRAPDGMMIQLTDDPTMNPIAQLLAAPRFGLYYDTGFQVGTGNFAEDVSLMSRHAPGAGQTFFVQKNGSAMTTVPVDLALNTQIMDVGGGQSLQFFAVANNDLDQSQLEVENIGIRAYNRRLGSAFEGWSLALGTQQSLFGETVLKPAGLDLSRTLIGTVDRTSPNLPQLALHIPLSNYLTWKIAVEKPYNGDIMFAPMTTELTRWPTFATNLTWKDDASHHLLHLGGLVRSFGFQEAMSEHEHFATGWGLSAIAKVTHNNSANFFGIAGGNGVGDYIQGVSRAAAADATSIHTVSGLGIFAGRQTLWRDEFNEPLAELNLAYGYSLMETPALFAGMETNRKLHQGWINYTRFLSDQVGVGVEYQYGYRRERLGDVGEDHRIMLMIAIRSAPTKNATVAEDFAEVRSQVTGKGGADEDLGPPRAPEDALPAQSMSATVSGRALDDVVNQFQLGGPAYQQGL